MVTASEDDTSPVVMVWDLRNARAPEKVSVCIATLVDQVLIECQILTGHEKGILSLSWCGEDEDLLLSCGKDNRALCWNPQTAEVVGELPSAGNWAFQVQWCFPNPNLLATANFDGTIGVHSIQNTNESAGDQVPLHTPKADGSDVFDVPGYGRTSQPTVSLKQPPKWLRRPVSNSFGYGGQLVTVSNLPSAQGMNQSSVVHLRKVVTEGDIVKRARELKAASDKQALDAFAKIKAANAEVERVPDFASWKALASLFNANSREELVTLLGFSKDDIAARVAEAVEKLRTVENTPTQPPSEELNTERERPRGSVVSFAEPQSEKEVESDPEREHTPSEVSASVASDHTDLDVTKTADGESTTTVPSLFGDDNGTPQMETEGDFFSTIGTIRGAVPTHMQIPHTNYAHDSSVAATIGSRPSSAASESVKNNTFRIYPSDESDTDRLVTKALVLGDFESAVKLCLSAERFADAILLAVRGGPELLRSTQQAYFSKRTVNLPYLRLFQSIVTEDLDDIVQNADLQDWQDIFVVLCTFARPDEFAGLAEQLGQRLEFHSNMTKNEEGDNSEELRKHATLTYLAAGGLEKVVNIWIEEMAEEEYRLLEGTPEKAGSRYSAHAHALQTFMEKVMIFRSATKFVDSDLTTHPDPDALRAYKLASLYERYYEYADLLATQGLVKEAVDYLKLIPSEYQSPGGARFDFAMARERLLAAASAQQIPKQLAKQATAPIASTSTAPAQSGPYGYPSYGAQHPQAAARGPQYAVYSDGASSVHPQQSDPYAPAATAAPTALPTQAQSFAPGSYAPPAAAQVPVPAPPPPIASAPSQSSAPAPPPKRDNQGWNDPPKLDRRTPVSSGGGKGAIVSPFPNSTPPSLPGSPMQGSQQMLPPPPRPGSTGRTLSQGPPPMRAPPGGPQAVYGHPPPRGFPPPQQQQPPQPQVLPPPPRGHVQPQYSGPPGPGRTMSPPQVHQPPPFRQTQPPPPPGVRMQGMPPQQGAPSPYVRATPPPGWNGPGGQQQQPMQPPPQATSHYGAPPGIVRQPGAPGMPPSGPPPMTGPPRGPPPKARTAAS